MFDINQAITHNGQNNFSEPQRLRYIYQQIGMQLHIDIKKIVFACQHFLLRDLIIARQKVLS